MSLKPKNKFLGNSKKSTGDSFQLEGIVVGDMVLWQESLTVHYPNLDVCPKL